MRDEVHRRALRTAAKVALVASQVACSKEAPPPAATVEPARAGQSASPSTATAPPMDEKSCLAAAQQHNAKREHINMEHPDPTAPPALVECCRSAFEKRKRDGNSIHFDACCDVLGEMGGVCTPWGPPPPPPFV